MAETGTPLIAAYHPGRLFAWRAGQPVTAATALADIQAVARALAGRTAYFNVCDDRYLFTVAFAAGCCAGALNLLPQTRQSVVLDRIREHYTDAPVIDDGWVKHCLSETRPASTASPVIPDTREVAVVFTSGSTGRPDPQVKRWGDLAIGSALLRQRFFAGSPRMHVVASVSPQHMYGLENSVLLVFHAGFAADSARPFMPWQIADALARLPEPRALFTTPIQLKACVEAGVDFPPLACIISATAPLSPALAGRAERAWQTEIQEIYGSSETGSIASRRTAATDVWQLYDSLRLEAARQPLVRGGQLPRPMVLDDTLEIIDSQHFRLLGRADDIVKVAGKRISLAGLTSELLALDGVADAVVFASPDAPAVERPTALVVASERSTRDIGAALARRVDPVFVPRPIVKVTRLPRNAMGKLARADLIETWRNVRQSRGNTHD